MALIGPDLQRMAELTGGGNSSLPWYLDVAPPPVTVSPQGARIGGSGEGESGGVNLGDVGNLVSLGKDIAGGGSDPGLLGGALDSIGSSFFGPSVSSITSAGPVGAFTSEAALTGSGLGAAPGLAGSFAPYLGGAGLGFGAGTLLNKAVGGKPTGGMIGSGTGALAGAAIGSLIPGIGTILGGLLGGAGGGLFGGMFGPHPTVGPGQGVTLAYGDAPRIYGAAADNGGNPEAAKQWAQDLADSLGIKIASQGGTGLANGGRSVSLFNNKEGYRLKLGGDNTGTLYNTQDEANKAALDYLMGAGIVPATTPTA